MNKPKYADSYPPPRLDAPSEPVIPSGSPDLPTTQEHLIQILDHFDAAAAEPSKSVAQLPPRRVDAPSEPVIPRNAQQQDLGLPMLVVAFCFTAAFEIAFRSAQTGRLLEHAGLLCGVTAFFAAITVSFPLCLKLISWIVYALSLLAISFCNCPPPL